MNGRGVTVPTNEHLGERAELYALGVLERAEADDVNAHAARCVECAKLVGAAERAITALDAATVPELAPPPDLAVRIAAIGRAAPLRRVVTPQTFVRSGAIAASLLLVIGGVAGTRDVLHLRDVVAQDDVALSVVANSHFKHATLTKADPSSPTAKVLWGLSNRWVYVIVDSAACACSIVALTDGGERDLGAPLGRGATAAVFANDLPRVRRIEMRRDGRTLESTILP